MIKLPEKVWLGDIYGYTEAQLKQAVRDAYEDAAELARTKMSGLGAEAAIRALIKEIQ